MEIAWQSVPATRTKPMKTMGGGYSIRHLNSGGISIYPLNFMSEGVSYGLRQFVSLCQAKRAAELHSEGASCSCPFGQTYHKKECPLCQ